ncbi:MAG: hypothetical protein AAGA75_19420 [Cyanobacteria bacterium P01_E01_bin.6]
MLRLAKVMTRAIALHVLGVNDGDRPVPQKHGDRPSALRRRAIARVRASD